MNDNEAIARAVKEMQIMVLACKATGGYKWRERIPLPDREVDQLMGISEARLMQMARRLAVAETMLREPAPSIHARWEEYQRRCSAT